MYLSEIVLRKRYLEYKLDTIDKYIHNICNMCASTITSTSTSTDLLTGAISYKFDLLSKIRSHNVLISNLNKETFINVSGVELSVFEAMHLLKTLESKLDTFTKLIKSEAASSLDALTIFSKNDILFDEYQNIYLTVLQSDLITKWEG